MAAPKSISLDSEQGPQWDDVREYLAYLEGVSQRRIQLLIRCEATFSNRYGFRVEIYLDGLPIPIASVGIGRNYAAGARTMAGAAYQACLRGEEALELAKDVAVTARTARHRKRRP